MGQFPGISRDLREQATPARRPGSAGRSPPTIVRSELLEKPVMSGGSGGSGRLRSGEHLSPFAEEGVEGLGHDVRGAPAAISAGLGGMIGLRRLGNSLSTATWLIFNWLRQPDMSEKLVEIG